MTDAPARDTGTIDTALASRPGYFQGTPPPRHLGKPVTTGFLEACYQTKMICAPSAISMKSIALTMPSTCGTKSAIVSFIMSTDILQA